MKIPASESTKKQSNFMTGKFVKLRERDYSLDFILIGDRNACKVNAMKISVPYLDHKSRNWKNPRKYKKTERESRTGSKS